jgi:hypothetical protein
LLVGIRLLRAHGQEAVAVADGLHGQEQHVQRERGDGRERELGRRALGSGPARRERRQHEAQRARVPTVASAEAVPSALNETVPCRSAPTSTDSPTDPVARDHHGREDGVPGERRGLRPAGDHQRDDERHLDDRHGDREHERAERLPDPVGDHLRVVDGRQHRTGEKGADHHEHGRPRLRAPGRREQEQRRDGDGRRPAQAPQEGAQRHAHNLARPAPCRRPGDYSSVS